MGYSLYPFRSLAEQPHAPQRRAERPPTLPPAPPRLTDEQQRTRNAQAIIRAGQLRRGEIPDALAPDLNPTAAAILAAGRKRRNEP